MIMSFVAELVMAFRLRRPDGAYRRVFGQDWPDRRDLLVRLRPDDGRDQQRLSAETTLTLIDSAHWLGVPLIQGAMVRALGQAQAARKRPWNGAALEADALSTSPATRGIDSHGQHRKVSEQLDATRTRRWRGCLN